MCHLRSRFCYLATTTTVLGTKTCLKLNFKKCASEHRYPWAGDQGQKITYRAKFTTTEQCRETRLLGFYLPLAAKLRMGVHSAIGIFKSQKWKQCTNKNSDRHKHPVLWILLFGKHLSTQGFSLEVIYQLILLQNTISTHFSNDVETYGIKFIFTILYVQNIAQQKITKCQ